MPKDDDGMLDKLDGRVERVERVEGFSRKERKGRRDLNHEIHGIHGNGRARWSHRNPLSFVVRPPSPILCPPSSVVRPASLAGGCWRRWGRVSLDCVAWLVE